MNRREDQARTHLERGTEALKALPTGVDAVRRAKMLQNIEAARASRPAAWFRWAIGGGVAAAALAAGAVLLAPEGQAPGEHVRVADVQPTHPAIEFAADAKVVSATRPRLQTGSAKLVMPEVPPPTEPVRLDTPHARIELTMGEATVLVVDGVTTLEVIAGRATWIVAGRTAFVEAGQRVQSGEPAATRAVDDAAIAAGEPAAERTSDDAAIAEVDGLSPTPARSDATTARREGEVGAIEAAARSATARREATAIDRPSGAIDPTPGGERRAETSVGRDANARGAGGAETSVGRNTNTRDGSDADANAHDASDAMANGRDDNARNDLTARDDRRSAPDATSDPAVPGSSAARTTPRAPPTDAETRSQQKQVEAARSLVRRDAAKAERMAAEVLELRPAPKVEAGALMVVADARRRAKDAAVAARLYARVAELPEGRELHEEALLRRAELLEGLGDLDDALSALDRAERLDAHSLAPERAALQLGLIQQRDGAAAAATRALTYSSLGGAAMARARLDIARAVHSTNPVAALVLLDAIRRHGGSRATLEGAEALRKKIDDR